MRIFDDKGALLDVDVPPQMRDRYEKVRAAYEANKAAEAAVTAAFSVVESALAAVANTEAYFAAHFKPQTAHDLWKENFGGGPRNRMNGVGRI